MKVLALVMAVLFGVAVVVQYNDPDPLRWMLLYGLGAVACGAVAAGRCPSWLAWVTLAAYVLPALYMTPAIAHVRWESFTKESAGSIPDEEAREALGMWIGALWFAVMAAWTNRRFRTEQATT